MSPLETIEELFAIGGRNAYLGEQVSQLEHALQAATLAEQQGASPALITAALLHDVGHLLDARASDPHQTDQDHVHENIGAAWVEQHFGPEVVRPIALHVAAKRYLCAVHPNYLQGLSPASIASLNLQGGPFSSDEVTRFRQDPHADDAVRLRHWDDQAKIPGLVTPPLGHFRDYLSQALAR